MFINLSKREDAALCALAASEGAIECELVKLRASVDAIEQITGANSRMLHEKEEQFKAVIDMSQAGIFASPYDGCGARA